MKAGEFYSRFYYAYDKIWEKIPICDKLCLQSHSNHSSIGRYISEEGLKKLNENGAITDVKELIRLALDVSDEHFIRSEQWF